MGSGWADWICCLELWTRGTLCGIFILPAHSTQRDFLRVGNTLVTRQLRLFSQKS